MGGGEEWGEWGGTRIAALRAHAQDLDVVVRARADDATAVGMVVVTNTGAADVGGALLVVPLWCAVAHAGDADFVWYFVFCFFGLV